MDTGDKWRWGYAEHGMGYKEKMILVVFSLPDSGH